MIITYCYADKVTYSSTSVSQNKRIPSLMLWISLHYLTVAHTVYLESTSIWSSYQQFCLIFDLIFRNTIIKILRAFHNSPTCFSCLILDLSAWQCQLQFAMQLLFISDASCLSQQNTSPSTLFSNVFHRRSSRRETETATFRQKEVKK